MSKLPPRFTKSPPLGQGYDKTNTLEFFDGVLHQLYVGGHPGSGEVWVPVAGQIKEDPKPVAVSPTVPAGLAAGSITQTTAVLSWNASTDVGGPGLAGYNILRNGVQIGTSQTESFNDSCLTAATTYSYRVSAFDSATPPNTSARSVALSVTTAP